MAKLKKPLNSKAVNAANDQFYANHPDWVQNGQRIPLDAGNPDHQSLMEEWTGLYLANGGELDTNSRSRTTGKTRRYSTEPYVKFNGKRTGIPLKVSDEAHVIFATSNCIYVIDGWPLREYYVYLDIDPTDGVDFETMGLLWTDENGFPHYTDGEGNPTERVPAFVLAWSKKSSTDLKKKGASVAMIYDRDRNKLDEKRKKVEKTAPLPNKYRLDLINNLQLLDNGNILTTCLHVPRDKETLDVDKLQELIKRCDAAIEAAEKTRDDIFKYITGSLTNQTLYFHRRVIDDWLDAEPDRRKHLFTNSNTGKSLYQMTCEMFDKGLEKLLVAHEANLDTIEEILNDEKNLEQIGQIDLIVEDLYDKKGEHLLWRHQFMCEALGFYSGTTREHQMYDKFVAPLVHNLALPFGKFRNKCQCATCEFFEDDKTTLPDPPPLKGEAFWKSKDLKLGTRTGLRLIDLFTKYKDNIGFVIARNKLGLIGGSQDFKYAIGLSLEFFVRTNMFSSGGKYSWLASEWIDVLYKLRGVAHETEDKIEEMVKEAKLLLEKQGNFKKKVLPKIGDSLTLIGAACVFWYIFTKEGEFDRKDAADFLNSVCEVGKAGLNLSRGALEKKLLAKYGAEKGGQLIKTIPKWGARIGFAGGVFQVASSYISLSDAADKGNQREFGWAAVTYTGASISLAGLALDLAPEPVVTKGSGIVLNFVGGIVYLAGTAGEFITRPDDVEQFLRNEYWWNEELSSEVKGPLFQRQGEY